MLNVVQKKEFLLKAYKVAQGSPDPSTQNGAIIVKQDGDQYVPITGACNTFVKGVVSKAERLKTPLKYSMVEHAERGAIYGLIGQSLTPKEIAEQCVMYVPWAACADCARAIIASGLRHIVVHEDMMAKTPDRWKESIRIAFEMLNEVGVEVESISGKLNGPKLLFNGETWEP